MRRYVKFIGIALFAYLLINCPSVPEVVEEEKPVPEKVAEVPEEKPPEKAPPEPPPEKVKPIEDSEILRAQNAIARAKEADAEYFEPEILGEAEDALSMAVKLKDSDPGTARKHLKEAKEKADIAYNSSVAKAVEALRARMERLITQLKSIEAHLFLPSEYRDAVSGGEKAEDLFAKGDIVEAREQAFVALADMSNLNERLSERLRWVSILKRDINQYLEEAERLQAHIRAPEQFKRVNQLYLEGIEAYQKYQLFKSEETLGSAREAALALIKRSQLAAAQEREKARNLMLEVMREIEKASELSVVTDEGTVIEPEPWSGEDLLPEEVEAEEQSDKGGSDQSFLIPQDGETAVLGEITEENLLTQAKELWKKGVEEWNKGNYRFAEEYFTESRKLVEAYKNQAVNTDYPVYLVRLIPERRDCLWRIAEYAYIYGNPYLWPKIWRRNRKLIQHPDLIYPGWKLVIPPE